MIGVVGRGLHGQRYEFSAKLVKPLAGASPYGKNSCSFPSRNVPLRNVFMSK